MSYKKIFWGIILIIIGLLIILKNLDVVQFSWFQFLMLWPVLLVLWGISIIPIKSWIKLTISLVIIVLSFLLISYVDTGVYRPFFYFHHDYDNNNMYKNHSEGEGQVLSDPYDSTVRLCNLRFDVAAGTFEVGGQTNELLEFDNRGYIGKYEMTSQDIDGKRVIQLKLKEPVVYRHHRNENRVFLKLNEKPEWDMDFDIGAASMHMDLSNYMIRQINIDGGASSLELTLGDKAVETNVDIEAGASSVLLRIPKTSGCEISANTVLSSRSLKDFNKMKDHTYQTDNYDTSTNKIIINIDVAISSIEVIRY